MNKMRDVIDLGSAGRAAQAGTPAGDGARGPRPDGDQPAEMSAATATEDEEAGALQPTLSQALRAEGDAAVTDEENQQAEHSGGSAIPQAELDRITADVIRGLKSVYDPEIPVDIYELGLIYKVDLSDERLLAIDMTLTAPGCPVAGEMPGWVEGAVRGIDGVDDVKVNMVFEPAWTPERMSDEARLELGWM